MHICTSPPKELELNSTGHSYIKGQMHNCGVQDCPSYKLWAQDLEKTGHLSMLARTRAAHKMVMSLLDEFEEGEDEGELPKWIRGKRDRDFYQGMVEKFDTEPLENVVLTAKQWFYLYDLYQRSL
jgi:hypothetical protein